MRYVLGIIGVLALLASLGSCMMAKSSLHETLGVAFAIVGVLGIGMAAILGELEAMHRTVKEEAAQYFSERQK